MTAKDRPVSKPATDDYRENFDRIFSKEEDEEEAIEEEEDEDDGYCTHCAGTGEGMHDGARCCVCGGKGYVRNFDPDDFDPPEDR